MEGEDQLVPRKFEMPILISRMIIIMILKIVSWKGIKIFIMSVRVLSKYKSTLNFFASCLFLRFDRHNYHSNGHHFRKITTAIDTISVKLPQQCSSVYASVK